MRLPIRPIDLEKISENVRQRPGLCKSLDQLCTSLRHCGMLHALVLVTGVGWCPAPAPAPTTPSSHC